MRIASLSAGVVALSAMWLGCGMTHDFATSGTREVRLTVVDDEGAEASVVVEVSVVRHNAAPAAAFTVDCTYLVCTVDASASTDPDGTIASYDWDFGDGQVATTTEPVATHTFEPGTYTVRLTVTDNDGGEDTTTRTRSPVAARPIAYVGSAVNQGNVSTPNAAVPAETSTGDRLVMVLSLNDAGRTIAQTSGVTGWDLVDTIVSGTMQTLIYTKVAGATDAGRPARFTLDAAAKYMLTIAAYSGDLAGAPAIATAAETVLRRAHTTPVVEADDGDWALSYWADKSSATTGFELPEGLTSRQATCAANAGRICSVLADSAAGVAGGGYGDLVATADAPAATAAMVTIVLRQDG